MTEPKETPKLIKKVIPIKKGMVDYILNGDSQEKENSQDDYEKELIIEFNGKIQYKCYHSKGNPMDNIKIKLNGIDLIEKGKQAQKKEDTQHCEDCCFDYEKRIDDARQAQKREEIDFLESWLDTDITNLEVYDLNKNRLRKLKQELKEKN